MNFKLLQKILEIFLVKPSLLKKQLTNCTMFITLMTSVKVTLLVDCELSCWEIFKTILKHDDIMILTGPFDEPYRALRDLPEKLRKLAPENKHKTSQYGLFLPIKKW